MERGRKRVIVYIVSILVVNVVFLYARSLVPESKQMITYMHVFFGLIQLVALVPKIVAELKGQPGRE